MRVEKCRKYVLGNVLKIPCKFLRLYDFLWGYSLSESKKYKLDLEPFGSGKWEANHLKEFNHDTAFACTVVNVKFRYVQRS